MTIGDILFSVKPQKAREVVKVLRSQGWRHIRDAKGGHEIWGDATGDARVSVPIGHRYISPGVLAQLERAGLSIPEEWK